jgi:hypothetical protein
MVFSRPMVSLAHPRFGPATGALEGPYPGYWTAVILPLLSYV